MLMGHPTAPLAQNCAYAFMYVWVCVYDGMGMLCKSIDGFWCYCCCLILSLRTHTCNEKKGEIIRGRDTLAYAQENLHGCNFYLNMYGHHTVIKNHHHHFMFLYLFFFNILINHSCFLCFFSSFFIFFQYTIFHAHIFFHFLSVVSLMKNEFNLARFFFGSVLFL